MNEKLFTCKFFEHFDKTTAPLEDFKITVVQPEYSVDSSVVGFDRMQIVRDLQKFNQRPKIPFKKEDIQYAVSYEDTSNVDVEKVHALIPSRDSLELLKFTLANMHKNHVLDYVVPVLIDDRSINPSELKELARQYSAVYIRVDYDSEIFNFSVLNNAAAAFLESRGVKDIILWNSDLWTGDSHTIPRLINYHKKNKEHGVYVTGTKLLYPPRDFCPLFDDNQFVESLAEDLSISADMIREEDPFGKVQFGGSSVTVAPFLTGQHVILPVVAHYGRLKPSTSVAFDREMMFMTGAFILCDLSKYKEVGGLNPSMRFCHQDGDLCFKMRQKNYRVMYYGKDCHLYHAESMSLASKTKSSDKVNHKKKQNYNNELFSNELIFGLKWNTVFAQGSLFL